MEQTLPLPDSLMVNAYTGEEAATAKLSVKAEAWLLRNGPPKVRTFLKPPKPADPRDWRDPRVGWGIVLPGNPSLTLEQQNAADDAPEAIRALVHERGESGKPAPVFRWKAGANRVGFLRRDGADIPVSMAPTGTVPGAIPRYLLVCATPEQIPWEVQFQLNSVCAVGRLALAGTALENYVQALRSGWNGAPCDAKNAVVWAVDHGPADITHLMRQAIASKVWERIQQDSDMKAGSMLLDDSSGAMPTAESLKNALQARKPGLIVTTSHGQTGPLDQLEQMTAQLGMPVGQDHSLVRPEALLQNWQPGGAIWYAHACCSAGSDKRTLFDGLVESGSAVDRVLKGVAAIGEKVAPLPTALLGASQPLRAFVGHVEPTFDWTLRQRLTGQFTTADIEEALYDKLCQPEPVGLAFRDFFMRVGGIYSEYDTHLRAFNAGADRQSQMLYSLLLARDVQSMVILGDPTAMLPPVG